MVEPTVIETINDCLVGSQGDDVVILMPKSRLTKPEALRLAAWLVVIASASDEFQEVLNAVRRT